MNCGHGFVDGLEADFPLDRRYEFTKLRRLLDWFGRVHMAVLSTTQLYLVGSLQKAAPNLHDMKCEYRVVTL